jgi:hypothetical protein
MTKKKSFILKVPMFLATKAAPVQMKVLFASCYVAMIAGYFFPLLGTIVSSAYALTVWQFVGIKYKDDKSYDIYLRFLLQRVIFAAVFVFTLFVICSNVDSTLQETVFNYRYWSVIYFSLGIINVFDTLLTLKGFIGVGYINAKNNN